MQARNRMVAHRRSQRPGPTRTHPSPACRPVLPTKLRRADAHHAAEDAGEVALGREAEIKRHLSQRRGLAFQEVQGCTDPSPVHEAMEAHSD